MATIEEAILYLEKMKEKPNVAYKDKLIIELNKLKQEYEQSILDREKGRRPVMEMKKWLNVELGKDRADKFKIYCKANYIKYEASEADNLIHFEVYVNEEEENKLNIWLRITDSELWKDIE